MGALARLTGASVDKSSSPESGAELAARRTQILIELYETGVTAERIGAALGLAASTVRGKIKKLRAAGQLGPQVPRAAFGAPKIAGIVDGIESEAARQSAVARMDYRDAMAALTAFYEERRAEIAAQEREALKDIERWRLRAVAAAEGVPVALGDIGAVRRGGGA